MMPFQSVYGRQPPSVFTYVVGTSPVQLMDSTFKDRDSLLSQLKANIQFSQTRMRNYANQRRTE